jgi:hypothetical protein
MFFSIIYFAVSACNVGDCSNECLCSNEYCCWPMDLLQFIDVKIVGYRRSHPGCAKIFGFVAARERAEPLRNFVYKRGIDNCETVSVKQETVIIFGAHFVVLQLSYSFIILEIHETVILSKLQIWALFVKLVMLF